MDGNHENFELLDDYPVSRWHGGKVHFIKESVIHLMRGQIYTIDGKTFFTFGGGYVIVTLMRKKFVSEYHWIDEDEMLDLIAIAQSSPGAIAVNGAIVVGYKLAGIAGIIVSVIATIIPPFVVISFISFSLNASLKRLWNF